MDFFFIYTPQYWNIVPKLFLLKLQTFNEE